MQAVEKMLDIDRIRQQAALHNRLEELGIPRIFQKGKQGYTGNYLDLYQPVVGGPDRSSYDEFSGNDQLKAFLSVFKHYFFIGKACRPRLLARVLPLRMQKLIPFSMKSVFVCISVVCVILEVVLQCYLSQW